MRILHYTLGFPPYRSGGLVKYAESLMNAQCKQGHVVAALYPGGTSVLCKKCHVKAEGMVKPFDVYTMLNPMPIPLFYGVKDVGDMIRETKLDRKSFERLLKNMRPEVFHIHTFMGLPKSYLQMAHEANVRIVYTTHDYFGLCPKVNFMDAKGMVCHSAQAGKCAVCNKDAKHTWVLRVRNFKCLIPVKRYLRRFKL